METKKTFVRRLYESHCKICACYIFLRWLVQFVLWGLLWLPLGFAWTFIEAFCGFIGKVCESLAFEVQMQWQELKLVAYAWRGPEYNVEVRP